MFGFIQERAEAAEAGPRRGRSRSANLLEHLYFAHIACLYCSHPPHCVSLFESVYARRWGCIARLACWCVVLSTGCIARLACWCVVLSTGSSASDFARHTFRLTPRVVRRLCVAAQRNPWAPRGRSRGPGDKRGAPARCLVLYRREPKRPKPVRDEAEAGRRTFSNICISRTSRVCIVAIALCLLSLSLFSACFCLFLPRQPSANFVLAKLPHWVVKVLLTLALGVLASKIMLP